MADSGRNHSHRFDSLLRPEIRLVRGSDSAARLPACQAGLAMSARLGSSAEISAAHEASAVAEGGATNVPPERPSLAMASAALASDEIQAGVMAPAAKVAMQEKKRQKLLEKNECRPTSEVMRSAPAGSAHTDSAVSKAE